MSSDKLYIGRSFGQIVQALRRARRFTQHDLAAYIDRDNTFISKMESGRIQCSVAELGQLADALTDDMDTRASLFRAFESETGKTAIQRDVDEEVTTLNTVVQSTQRLRLLGEPQLAFELASSQLESVLRVVRGTGARVQRGHPILPLACELVLEHTKAALDFMPSSQVKHGILSRSLAIQAEVSSIASDPVAATATQLAHEAAAYCTGQLIEAHRIGLDLLNDIPDYNDSWTAEVIRSVSINAGLIGDDTALKNALLALAANRTLLSLGDVGFVLEGLARGFTKNDPIKARAIIDEARNLYRDAHNVAPIRLVQLARAQALADLSTKTRRLSERTRNEVERAIVVSREKGYTKYEVQLVSLLKHSSP